MLKRENVLDHTSWWQMRFLQLYCDYVTCMFPHYPHSHQWHPSHRFQLSYRRPFLTTTFLLPPHITIANSMNFAEPTAAEKKVV